MSDTYNDDYKALQDLESDISKDIKHRKATSKSEEFSVRIEESIYKKLNTFQSKLESTIKFYSTKYKKPQLGLTDIETTKRINQLHSLRDSHSHLKDQLDSIINEKYKYVKTIFI